MLYDGLKLKYQKGNGPNEADLSEEVDVFFFNYCNNKKLLIGKIKKFIFHDLQKVLSGAGHLDFSRNFEL